MPKKASYLPRGQRLISVIFSGLVRSGLLPGAHLLSVRGRKSGVMRTTPLFVLKHEGARWLVAGVDRADWVKNLRAAGWCELIHDRQKERVKVSEVSDISERASIIRAFVQKAPGARRGYTIAVDAPLEEFVAIAPQHPVFRVIEPGVAPAKS